MSPKPSSGMVKFFTYMNRYFCATMTYGFIRAVSYDYEGTKVYFNHKTMQYETKPLLYTDFAGRMFVRAFSAIVAWPYMMGEDFVRLECFMRGKDPAEYSVNVPVNFATKK